MATQPLPKLISVNRACRMLDLPASNPATLFRLCLKGRIEYVHTDEDQIKIVSASVLRFLEEHEVPE